LRKFDLAAIRFFESFQRNARQVAVISERTRLAQNRQGPLAHLRPLVRIFLIGRVGIQSKAKSREHGRIIRIGQRDFFQQWQRGDQVLRLVDFDGVLAFGRILGLRRRRNSQRDPKSDGEPDSF
jgi:hypothetical protein